ncbi:MAG: hypothetical protein AB7I24_18255 [Candidatus Nanopelagicales bacterium]
MSGDPRHSSAYVMRRRRFIKAQPVGTPCALCGEPIDTRLPGTHPAGPTIEHVVPVRHRPDLALDDTLWALAHKSCNDHQGGRAAHDDVPPGPVVYVPSQEW